eukprot:3893877-Ditylum_brightwellii.AAC.1
MIEVRTITSQLEQSANASNMTTVRSFCSFGNGGAEYGTSHVLVSLRFPNIKVYEQMKIHKH